MGQNFVNSAIYGIRQLTAEIDETQAEIDELIRQKKQKLEEQRDVLQGFVAEILEMSPSEDHSKAIVNYLYWGESYVRVETLSQIINVGLNAVCRYAGSLYVEGHCWQCKQPMEIEITARNSTKYNDWKRGKSITSICDCCQQERNNASDRYRQERIARIQFLRSLPYSEYLKTEHWQDTRRRALKRAGFACQVCNVSNVQLHVHHRTYERRGEEANADVIVLCADCHRTFHENGKVAS